MRYLIAAAVLGLAGSSFADIINVPADYATIQGAVDAAVSGDEVVVAPGTYTGTGDQAVNMAGKAITLRASGAVEETIIDGEGARQVIKCNSGESAATTIVGFSITGGDASYGGGIYCYNSSPTITNCTISGNSANVDGGGIYCSQSSPTLTNCEISNNTTYNRGGGICGYDSNPTLTNCTIKDNTADSGGGGGIYCYNSNPTLSGCTISDNTANHGGGISCYESNPTLTNCTIKDNTADSGGGGGILCTTSSSPTLSGCTISNNIANDSGGGIWCSSSCSPTITNCSIEGNTAGASGGGLYSPSGSAPAIQDTSLCSNIPDQTFGNWTDKGGNTIADVCPWYQGGCCTGNSLSCVIATEEDCEYFGHTWLGEGATCDDSPCPTSCLGDVNADGEVSVNDILTLIANWGPCP